MIAIWVVYSIAITAALLGIGMALEYLARAVRWPTRPIWLGVMALALVWSAAALLRPVERAPAAAEAPSAATVAAVDASPRRALSLPAVPGVIATLARWDAMVARWESPLRLALVALPAAALLLLAGILVRLHRARRAMRATVVDGVPILLSHDIGPALIGFWRYRVVLPDWALALPDEERRIVIAHEMEHARARDPLLLLAATLVLCAQPWNVALWGAFARLRFAIEADCDARVLAARVDVRRYGRLLLKVLELTPRALAPLASFAESSDLERRVHRMTERPPRLLTLPSLAATVAAAALLLLAVVMPLPAQTGLARSSVSSSMGRVDTARAPSPESCRADSTTPIVPAGCKVPPPKSWLFRGIQLSRTQQDSVDAITRRYRPLYDAINSTTTLPGAWATIRPRTAAFLAMRRTEVAEKRTVLTDPAQLRRFDENADSLRKMDERISAESVKNVLRNKG
ncbi:MAG TPA: M56 family metallopeptidase [Gemmatimonadaceae bacterium]|nr:M56 family metallopeptidase [Gemmatimonadaceae bacterium]